MHKIASSLTALALSGALMLPALAAAPQFSDVPADHWAGASIQQAAEHNWVGGIGDGLYVPEREVSVAEWLAMVTRAVNPEEVKNADVSGQWYAGQWYGGNVQVAIDNRYHSFLPVDIFTQENMNRPMTRAEMACVVGSVLVQNGFHLDSETVPMIPDLDELNLNNARSYANGVMMTYSHGIIKGVDDTGRFNGYANMTRAQAAAVLCRMMEKVGKGSTPDPVPTPTPAPVVPTPNPVVPTPTPDPVVPQEPTGNYGPVGTMSNSPVTLSYETHKPVTDYWAQNSEAFKAQVDRDTYNAAVQSLKDYQYSGDLSDYTRYSRNEYYNYAVFLNKNGDQSVRRTISSIGNSSLMGFRSVKGENDARIWTPNLLMDHSDRIYMSYVNRITDSMSDKEAAKICMEAVTDHWVYGPASDSWRMNKDIYTGRCGELAHAYQEVLAAAGIPSIYTATAEHAWTYVLLDGVWYSADPTLAVHDAEGSDETPIEFWLESIEQVSNAMLSDRPDLRFDLEGSPANVTARFIEQSGFHR